MIEEGKFGVQEAICLTTITIAAKAFYTSPSLIMELVGTTGWYMTLLSAAVGAVGFTFIYFLLKRFPGKNIMEIYSSILGKFLGFIFSFMLAVWLLFVAAVDLREYAEVLKIHTLPQSPLSFIIGLFILGIIVMIFLGLESLARFAKLFAYILLFGFASVLILAKQNYNPNLIFPIFGYGLGKTVYHGLTRSSAYGEVIIVAVFAGTLQGINHIKRIGYISIVLAGLIISSALLAFTMTFPYSTGQELIAPMYAMSSLISYGRFFSRLESIFLFIWDISSLIEVTALFFASLMIFCHIFGINDKKPVTIPYSITFFGIVMIPRSIIDISTGFIQSFREWGWAFFYLPPLIVLMIAILKKKKGGVKNA